MKNENGSPIFVFFCCEEKRKTKIKFVTELTKVIGKRLFDNFR